MPRAESWYLAGTQDLGSTPGSAIGLLGDLEQITSTLCLNFPICKMRTMFLPSNHLCTGFRVAAVLVCIRKKKNRSTCGTLETNKFIRA
uniref:Uncharacterized protein n=1 Tax=Chrysemys picta bellii TaxID=8478 RepID=A0A8C3HJJ0_CHRPI